MQTIIETEFFVGIDFVSIDARRQHQVLIGRLITKLTNLYHEGKISLLPIPEAMIDETETSPMPDVMLVDKNDETVVVIEITNTQAVKRDAKKIQELFADYNVREGLIYDYKAKAWHRFKNGVGEVFKTPSFCETIGYDLDLLIR
jgi:Uma2 family endonuclease